MKNKVDKSLEEVWEMKAAAYERFLKSGFNNYADYLKFRQKQIDEKFNIIYHSETDEKSNHSFVK